MKTTKDTLSKRKVGIRLSQLPQTFQDAVYVCLGLGIQFLWIDSLCIIQGDRLDWEQESAKMAGIYAGSHLNIAATHADSSAGGCFSSRWTTVDINRSTQIASIESYQIIETHKQQEFTVHVRLSLDAGHNDLLTEESRLLTRRRAPLLTRAWVFQERCLARRTLHFHSQELIWECKTGLTCECKDLMSEYRSDDWHQGWKAKHLSWKSGELEDLPSLWLRVVEGFSKLSLTHETDRLPALSGMASRFCGSRLKTYLAGLWQEDIVRALLWYVGPHWISTSSRPLPLRAPTWSWASLDLVKQVDFVMYPFFMNDNLIFHQDPAFQVIQTQCRSSTLNPYGEVSDGNMIVQCSFNSAIFVKRSARAGNSSLILDCDVAGEDGLVMITIQIMQPDVALDKPNSDEVLDSTIVHCLLAGSGPRSFAAQKAFDVHHSPEPSSDDDINYLTEFSIIVKDTGTDDLYERIGFLERQRQDAVDCYNWFHQSQHGEFKIL